MSIKDTESKDFFSKMRELDYKIERTSKGFLGYFDLLEKQLFFVQFEKYGSFLLDVEKKTISHYLNRKQSFDQKIVERIILEIKEMHSKNEMKSIFDGGVR